MNELIIVKQLPVIEERLKTISAVIDEKIALADSLVCSEETVKRVKAMRAELNKDRDALEDQRKAVKAAVVTPYEQFESVYKQYVLDKYKAADANLKSKIDGVENELRQRKRDSLKEYFDEYRLSRHVDFISMDTWRPNVTLAGTMTALKKEAKAFVDKVCDELALIDTQEHKDEIHVEYRRTLNVSQAITSVAERHKALEEQRKQREEADTRRAAEAEAVKRVEVAAAPLAPPKVAPQAENDPLRTLAFRVTAPVSKLRELKKFLDDGGYQYE